MLNTTSYRAALRRIRRAFFSLCLLPLIMILALLTRSCRGTGFAKLLKLLHMIQCIFPIRNLKLSLRAEDARRACRRVVQVLKISSPCLVESLSLVVLFRLLGVSHELRFGAQKRAEKIGFHCWIDSPSLCKENLSEFTEFFGAEDIPPGTSAAHAIAK